MYKKIYAQRQKVMEQYNRKLDAEFKKRYPNGRYSFMKTVRRNYAEADDSIWYSLHWVNKRSFGGWICDGVNIYLKDIAGATVIKSKRCWRIPSTSKSKHFSSWDECYKYISKFLKGRHQVLTDAFQDAMLDPDKFIHTAPYYIQNF